MIWGNKDWIAPIMAGVHTVESSEPNASQNSHASRDTSGSESEVALRMNWEIGKM